MASGKPPSGRYLLIGKNLRSLRECQGLALGTAARRYGRSQGWMSTVENGLTPIRAGLQDLLEFYDCTDVELSKSLIGLADRGRQRDWSRHSAGTKDYAALEAGTSQISSFQPNLTQACFRRLSTQAR